MVIKSRSSNACKSWSTSAIAITTISSSLFLVHIYSYSHKNYRNQILDLPTHSVTGPCFPEFNSNQAWIMNTRKQSFVIMSYCSSLVGQPLNMYFIWSLKAGLWLWERQTGSGHWDIDDGLCVCALVVHWYEDSGHWMVIGQLRKHIIIIMVILVGQQ